MLPKSVDVNNYNKIILNENFYVYEAYIINQNLKRYKNIIYSSETKK